MVNANHSAKPELKPVTQSMALADGNSLPFVGRGNCKLQFGENNVTHPVWIAEIEPEGILRLDFLRDYGCELVCRNGSCELTNNRICYLSVFTGRG